MVFPTRPVWIYQLTQGIHITAGIACFPLLFAKLFTVFPELFQSPPVRSFGHLVERASIAVFVAASLMQITIGLLNTYQMYALFGFSFRLTHYALSWIVIGSLVIHIGVKLPVIARYWRKRDAYDADGSLVEYREDPDAELEVPDELQRLTGWRQTHGVTGRLFAWMDRTPAPREPQAVRDTRRGFLTAVAVATGVVVATTAGQSFRVLDPLNVFAPRKRGVGPQTLPVNRTAKAAGVLETATAPEWTLTIVNGSTREVFSRARLRSLAAARRRSCRSPASRDGARTPSGAARDCAICWMPSGAAPGAHVRITSLQQHGGFAVTEMQPEFARDPLTLVALELFGEDLDIDHGYPARIIAPGRPGVLQTKWLSMIEVIA